MVGNFDIYAPHKALSKVSRGTYIKCAVRGRRRDRTRTQRGAVFPVPDLCLSCLLSELSCCPVSRLVTHSMPHVRASIHLLHCRSVKTFTVSYGATGQPLGLLCVVPSRKQHGNSMDQVTMHNHVGMACHHSQPMLHASCIETGQLKLQRRGQEFCAHKDTVNRSGDRVPLEHSFT